MNELDDIIVFLEEQRDQQRLRSVADACGVPYSTLRKVMDRRIKNPSYSTIELIRDYRRRVANEDLPATVPQQAAWLSQDRRRQMG